MLKCIPIPSSAALLEAYRRRPPERHEHNKHCASQRSNPGGLDTRLRTTPLVFIPLPHCNSSKRITRHRIPASLAMPEMQNGEPENSSPFARSVAAAKLRASLAVAHRKSGVYTAVKSLGRVEAWSGNFLLALATSTCGLLPCNADCKREVL